MTARVLMVQGTSSSAGKSLLVTALCRIFARRGVNVAPFKAQNMSNNAAVCADGGEIGRSQALQAEAADVAPTCDMNPILLKPEAEARSQVIVNGRPWRTLTAREYFRQRDELWPVVGGALARLRERHELVVIEGAGSPAELNLHTREIVNMAVARHCQAPVLLVGDIDRGGVFAQLLGTLWLLEEPDRRLVRGFVVNKFRGDPTLFDSGVRELEDRGGVPVLGVIPWLSGLDLPEEDGQALDLKSEAIAQNGQLDITVIRLPRIANFDDFDPLANEPGVALRYVSAVRELGAPDAIILPGTKSTIADLQWLRETGLAEAILRCHRAGAQIIGICGGYQMLGRRIVDAAGVESVECDVCGLGLLPVETGFEPEKATHQVRADVRDDRICPGFRGTVTGYEIHMGRTTGAEGWLTIALRGSDAVSVPDGAVSTDGRCWGSYLHGLFANDGFRHAWLTSLGKSGSIASSAERREAELNRLADHVESAFDVEELEAILLNSKSQISDFKSHMASEAEHVR